MHARLTLRDVVEQCEGALALCYEAEQAVARSRSIKLRALRVREESARRRAERAVCKRTCTPAGVRS